MKQKCIPALMQTFREGYSLSTFFSDLSAGVIVGIVALPLAIAFAVASGCTPQQGLFTAIIAGFLISLFSGSRVQIGGPTGAFIVLVYAVVQEHGAAGLTIATMMAGVLLLFMGVMGLGKIIEYIPYPVTIGFTSGIALIILIGQIPNLLGLSLDHNPSEVIEKLELYGKHIGESSGVTIAIALITIAIIKGSARISSKIPGSLIALIIGSIVVLIFKLPIETIGARFGQISLSIPAPSLPPLSWELIVKLFPSALAIALLGGIESLLSAVVADGMTGYRHNSQMELIGQGIANIITPLFGGIPATGAIARTATNIKNGAKSPLSGIIHALTLLVIVLFAGPLVAYIPFAVLAGILILVAYNMGEWHLFFKILKSSKSDASILLATFLLTLFVDLAFAIQFGVVMAALLFMKRMADVTEMTFLSDDHEELLEQKQYDTIEVFEINGPFFFGASSRYQHTLSQVNAKYKVLVLRMRYVPAMDATALKALEETLYECKHRKTVLIMSGVQEQPKRILQTSPHWDIFSKQMYPTFEEAYQKAVDIAKEGQKA